MLDKIDPACQTVSGKARPSRFVFPPLSPKNIALGLAALCLAACVILALCHFPPGPSALSNLLLYKQDLWLLCANFFLVWFAGWRLGAWKEPLRFNNAALFALITVAVCLCYFGRQWILCGFDLSRDEQMATFDSEIFAAGLPVQPLPPFWQAHAEALNTLFMLPVARPVAWVSGYLPMNAALRALAGFIADPALTGPLMLALGALALWKCARLLWPENREAAVVAILLYALSGQVLLAAMTAYAMPAHLALNLVWLWLFLLDRRLADFSALGIGAVATGLHQPLFHPLFAAPFLFMLLRDRSWPRVIIYGVGYAALCAFWLAWPNMIHTLVSGPDSITAPMGTDFFTRLLEALPGDDQPRFPNMGANLLRFAAWQPALLLPLMAAGLMLGYRERPTMALAVCVALPVFVVVVILPVQGHGFGYRYLHGVFGPAILLAAQGWRQISNRELWLRPLFVRAMLGALFVALPLQLWFAHALYAPFADIDARIRHSNVDFIILGGTDAPFSENLVINRPDLSNRPIRLLAEHVDDHLISAICRPGVTVAAPSDAFFRQLNDYHRLPADGDADARISSLSPKLKAAGCAVEILDRL